MSKLLASLLEEPVDKLSQTLQELEKMSGYPAIDVRLVTDIEAELRTKLKQLRLDPADSLGRELYQQLRLKIAGQAQLWFAEQIAKRPTELSAAGEVLRADLKKIKAPQTVWALKSTAVKAILSSLPPKQVMKKLNYRSVASLLKYQKPAEIYAAARLHESAAWQSRLLKKIGQLRTKDFASRRLELIELNPKLVATGLSPVIGWPEVGVVIVLPIEQLARSPATYLATLVLVLKTIEELRSQSSYLKLNQVAAGFGQRVDGLVNGQPAVLRLDSLNLPWRSLQAYFGQATISSLPAIFEPHLQAGDLHWQSAESLLAKMTDKFRWWQATSYLALPSARRPVSLNLADLAIDHANRTSYGTRTTHYLRQALWDKIIHRYLEIPTFSGRALEALERQLLTSRLTSRSKNQPTEALAGAFGGWEEF